jgi:acetyltransferase-like isoleucine patch superfamily enzyme
LIAWLLPSCGFKLWALRSLGNHMGHDVVLGPSLVLNCGRFSIADGAAIMNFNIFRQLSSIELGPESNIGNFNQFTAAPDYQRYSPLVGKLIIGKFGVVTNRHYVDCSGQVILRPFAVVGGPASCSRTHICPERSVLAAGSLLSRAKGRDNMPVSSLYGGTPARCIQEIKELEFWDRACNYTPVVPFDDEKFRVE